MKNRFSRWRNSWISDLEDFNYFLSTSHPDTSYQVLSQMAFWFRKGSKIWIFKMTPMVPIRTTLAVFDLQVTRMLPIIRVNWPLGSGYKGNNRFSR